MQICSIELTNIKSHRDTRLDFSPGINVLSGPNGVGKSTVFEAIGYALFGVDAQSFVGNVERFIRIGAKRGEISVIFAPDVDSRYRVTRTLGASSRWLLAKEVGGTFEVEEHKDSKETEERLKELLGLRSSRSLAEQFELVIGPFQHDFLGPFVIRQQARRRDRFDEILGIDTWRKTFNDTKILANTIRSRIDSLESAMAPLREQVTELPHKREAQKGVHNALTAAQTELKAGQDQLLQVEEALNSADQREKQLKELEKEIATYQERITNGREMIARQKQLVTDAEQARQATIAAEPGKKAYEQADEELRQLRQKARTQRQLEQQAVELTMAVGKLDERLKVERAGIEKVRDELATEQAALTQQLGRLVMDDQHLALAQQLPSLRKEIERLRHQLGQLDGRRAGLEEGREKLADGICPFLQEPCLNLADQQVGDIFPGRFAELDQQRQFFLRQINELTQQEQKADRAQQGNKELAVQRQGVEKQLATLAQRHRHNEARNEALAEVQHQRDKQHQILDDNQQQLAAFTHVQTAIEAAEQELMTHQSARDLYVANSRQAAEVDQRREELLKYERLLQQLQNDQATKKNAYVETGKDYDSAEHGELRRRKDLVWGDVNTLSQKIKGLTADLERIAADIARLEQIEKNIAAKQEEVSNLQQKDELVKFLRNRVFRHVSGHLSERFREEISRRAGRIYRIIAEADEELLWGDNYRIVLRDMVAGELRERADDQLSGGQTMSAVVALRLAMLQTIGARIAFFDEPTSHLDAARRENLAHAFRAIDVGKEEVAEHWYDQLFLISHDIAFTEITDQILPLA